ncbi:MAG: TetR/AcrR family transcriptional regulator [candidate division Zixibacteria bacterium]|nr:TetR/AcrR family transcriptional regulator [candidate division Zixibacteria bacterium]
MSEQMKIAKREKIIQVASELFARNDFGRVQMDLVAEKADVAKGTLYNYFESKEKLYFSIIQCRLENLLSLLENTFDKREDVRINLKSFVTHFYGFMLKYPSFYLLCKKEEGKLNSDQKGELSLMRRKIKKLLVKVLEEGVEREIFRKTNMDSVADLILGILDAGVQRGLSRGLNPENSKKEREFLYNFILEGIRV